MDLGLSFTSCLRLLTPGGVLAIVAVLAMVPFSFQSIWRIRVYADQRRAEGVSLHRPVGQGPDRNFCPKCGARVFTSNLEGFPGTIFVTLGSLDNPEGIEPVLEMFTKRRAKPLDLRQFENMPS